MFCDRCGTSNRDRARFCRACGAPLLADDADPDTRELPETPAARLDAALARALDGKLTLERVLGRGGMGTVYLARDLALDRPVAVKLMHADDTRDERAVARFVREARLAAGLRHPNIVSVHAIGDADGIPYFTMDHIDGETLQDHVRNHGPLTEDGARQAIADVARALAHAHAQGIVHRDLKPGNVMIDGHGHVVVMDFGLAKARTAAELTSSGVVIGTPQYVSPEQLEGQGATERSDIYALGLVYYFLRTGQHLVEGDSITAVVSQHLTGRLRARAANHAAMRATPPLLLATLERDPRARPATLDGLLPTLRSTAAAGPAAAGPEAALEETRPLASAPAAAAPPPLSPARRVARDRMRALLDKMPKKEP